MVVVRGFGWLLLAMALAAVVHDALAWWSEGALRLLTLGGLWSRLDLGSLAGFQEGVERHIDPALWNWLIGPVLTIPAVLAFAVLGLACLWLGQRPRGRMAAGFVMGSRPPRKRRGRIGL